MKDNGVDAIHRIADQAAVAASAARIQATERSAAGADRVKAAGTALVESAREQYPHIQHRVADQAKPLAQTVAAQVQELAASGSERAKEISTRVNEDVLPTLRDVAMNAASAAVELWEAARERAAEAAADAQHDLAPVARHGLLSGGEKAREATYLVADRVTESADHARAASRHAADATVSTGKDAGATLLSGAAAAGIVYYAFMDKERREQTLRTINGMIGGTRELIRDIRGYDAQF